MFQFLSPINLCWQGGIRTPVLRREQSYSLPPLTTRPPTNLFFFKSFPLQIKSNSNQDIHTERSQDLVDVFINVHGKMNVANHPKRNGKIWSNPKSEKVQEFFHDLRFAPRAGFEPATNRLTVYCATTALSRNVVDRGRLELPTPCVQGRCSSQLS